MGFFQSKKRQSREPNETARLTPSVEAVLWKGEGESGQLRIAFGLNRIDDQGNQRRTFRPEHLPQLAEAIATLAVSFSQAKGIDRLVGEELSELGQSLVRALEMRKANGQTISSADDSHGKLLG